MEGGGVRVGTWVGRSYLKRDEMTALGFYSDVSRDKVAAAYSYGCVA